MPVYFYSNISIWYSWYINAFVSPMCIEGVIGRCCMCHAWQVRQGSHVAMWHFHDQLERNLRSAVWRSSAPGDAKSFGPAVLIAPAVLGYWWKHRWKWPQYTKMISTMQRFDDLNHLASCIILHHPVHLHPESSWIHARGFCDSYQDQCVGNGLCQGGLMWFDVGWQVPKALRCAKMRWEVLRSAECVRLKKMLYSDILAFGHSKKNHVSHIFALVCCEHLEPFETFWSLLEPFGTRARHFLNLVCLCGHPLAKAACSACSAGSACCGGLSDLSGFWGVTDGPRTSQAPTHQKMISQW